MFRLLPSSGSSREGTAHTTSTGSLTASRMNSELSSQHPHAPPPPPYNASATEIPPSIVYNFPPCRGPSPNGRWAHSTCSMGSMVVLYGGIGTGGVYGDLWALDTASMTWRNLLPRAASPKDAPEKAMGHAAAALGSKMWLFGGQQGRSLLRKLHVLDIEAMTWTRMARGSDALPCARAGHAMVAVPGAIYLFGGQGKKLLNDMHALDPETGQFREVKANGRPPLPRRGMSLVHDGKDALISFGGAHAGGADAALSVYSLSRAEWSSPVQQGTVPAARTDHSAVLLAPHQMLIFGGCNTQGNFFNDAHILDTRTFTWHSPHLLNAAPAPRYHHSCCAVGGRAYFYGGINSKQTFEGVVVMDTRCDTDISNIAEELRALSSLRAPSGVTDRMTSSGASAVSSAPSTATTATAAAAAAAGPVDVMKVQLMDLLYKRNMEELQAHAGQRTEAAEQLLAREREVSELLRREVLQLKILLAEAEEAAAEATERAKVAAAQAGRGSAAAVELRASLEAKERCLAEREAELDTAKRLHQSLVKELGLVASRHAKLQQQQRLKASAKAPAAGADAGITGSDGSGPGAAARPQRQLVGHSAPLLSLSEEDSDQDGESAGGDVMEAPRGTGGSSSSAPGGTVLAHYEDMLALLGEAEQQREEVSAQLAASAAAFAAADAERSALRLALAAARGEAGALAPLGLEALLAAEAAAEAALRRTREAVLARRMAEVERAASEQQACSLCLERPRGIVFNCGHQSCAACSEKLPACPFCRTAITARIKLFNS